ncbi:MAG: hypothetical protein IJX90_08070 [Blautia sp.]|nr:hypothetical protein [Blautia sp.]
MKHILIYGDSNTFGCNPAASDGKDPNENLRYEPENRWPYILRDKLGVDYEVIDEGLPGRTAALDEPFKPFRKGTGTFVAIAQSHYPVDLLIFLLGVNDLKFAFHEQDVQKSMEALLQIAMNPFTWDRQSVPKILLIAPPALADPIRESCFYGMFREEHVAMSKKVAPLYKDLAEEYGCEFMDAGTIIEASPIDCVHFTREGHHVLAEAVEKRIREIL